jgi:transposase
MAKRYRPVNRDQPFLLPPDMREWLPPEHPVWLVITVVEDHLDTSVFHATRRTGGAGTAGYDPDMLLAVLVWAYAHQVTSSRRIEQLCQTDVAFRVICGGSAPRHVTISQFRAAFPGLAGEFFAQVLVLCARLGMGKLGVVALDGMKIAASASTSANRTEEHLAKLAAETVAAHGQTDAAEDELFGAGVRGDEVPGDDGGGGWSPRWRDQRIAAALAGLQADREAAEDQAGQQAAEYLAHQGAGRRGQPPASAAVTAAAVRLEAARTARMAQLAEMERRAAGPKITGSRRDRPRAGVEDYCLVVKARGALAKAQARAAARAAAKDATRGPVRNITDPDSRLMPVRGGGFIQAYNPQNVTSQDELLIATELTDDTTDTAWFEPMLRHAEDAARLITAYHPPPASPHTTAGASPGHSDVTASLIGLFLADAGYLSEHNLAIEGPDRLIATGKTRDLNKAARDPAQPAEAPWTSPAITAMAARLATEDGMAAYRQRSHIAETPHGHIKHNMRFRQLSMRGKPKAAAEWTFICAVHNLFKAITTGHLTTTTLNSLASHPPTPQTT